METNKEIVKAILDGIAKMQEFKCEKSGIYTIGVINPIVFPSGESFSTKYVTISRVANVQICGIEIECCTENKPSFVLPTSNEKEAEEAVKWMRDNKCLPRIQSMKTLTIPVRSIQL